MADEDILHALHDSEETIVHVDHELADLARGKAMISNALLNKVRDWIRNNAVNVDDVPLTLRRPLTLEMLEEFAIGIAATVLYEEMKQRKSNDEVKAIRAAERARLIESARRLAGLGWDLLPWANRAEKRGDVNDD